MQTEQQRTDFYRDVLTTAVEGGIGYWSHASHIERDGELRIINVTLSPIDELGDDFDRQLVDAGTVHQGIRLVRNRAENGLKINESGARQIMDTTLQLDAGDVDAELADQVVQVGMFGELVYG